MSKADKQRLRQEIQYIFQDPLASLDPRKTIGFSIAEPIKTHDLIRGEKNIQKRERWAQRHLESKRTQAWTSLLLCYSGTGAWRQWYNIESFM